MIHKYSIQLSKKKYEERNYVSNNVRCCIRSVSVSPYSNAGLDLLR